MRYSKAEERGDLDQIIDHPEDHIVYPEEAYTARGRILITRQHRSVGLHRYLYNIVRGIPSERHTWYLLRTCEAAGCVNPWHQELSEAPRWPDVKPSPLGPPRPTRADRLKARTHCPQGHPYTPDNTALNTDRFGYVHRSCLTCKRERSAHRRSIR